MQGPRRVRVFHLQQNPALCLNCIQATVLLKNVNKLLAWGHAKAIENLLENNFTDTAISDKFGDEKLILGSLQEKGKNILLRQETKAEKYTAVAAASILARSKFDEWFIIK